MILRTTAYQLVITLIWIFQFVRMFLLILAKIYKALTYDKALDETDSLSASIMEKPRNSIASLSQTYYY